MDESISTKWKTVAWLVVVAFLGVGLWWFPHSHTPSVGKGGLLLAVGATLMPLFWERIGTIGKMSWVAMLFLLLAVEYRAIDKEQTDQQVAFQKIGDGFTTILTNQQTSFPGLISQSQNNFDSLIHDERDNFNKMMANSIQAQRQENASFAALLKRENDLLNSQEELYEFASGTLLPEDDPTPKTCDPLAPDEFLIQMGDMAYVTNTLPFDVLDVEEQTVISLDKSETGALLVSINLIALDGRIIARINKNNSTINPASGLIITRSKSTLLLQDQYGNDVINARYLNDRAFSITGRIPYRDRIIALPLPALRGCIRARNTRNAVDIH